jgi:hypothetical protein
MAHEARITTGIVILGMHRTGSSLLAGIVNKWGAYAGEEAQLLPPNRWNQAGYWEYRPLVVFNHELLTSLGADALLPPAESEEERILELAQKPYYRDRALALIEHMAPSGQIWMWKDPRIIPLLGFWGQIWTDVRFIVSLRDPLSIARSLASRDGMPATAALLLWQRYSHLMLRFLAKCDASRVFVNYEQVLTDPAAVCGKLVEFLQRDGISEGEREARIAAMISMVRLDLNHSARPAAYDRTSMTRDQILLDLELKKWAGDGGRGKIHDDLFEIYPGWRDYIGCWLALRNAAKSCSEQLKQFKPVANLTAGK